jgi:hypothetical protein
MNEEITAEENAVVEQLLKESEEEGEIKTPDQVTMSEEHKKIVYRIMEVLRERGFNFWDSQQALTLTLAALNSGEQPIRSLDTAAELTRLFEENKIDKVMAKILCQVLAQKINDQVNQLSLSKIELSPIE